MAKRTLIAFCFCLGFLGGYMFADLTTRETVVKFEKVKRNDISLCRDLSKELSDCMKDLEKKQKRQKN
jgi:hypothetical protein